jgi:hypothetical protein
LVETLLTPEASESPARNLRGRSLRRGRNDGATLRMFIKHDRRNFRETSGRSINVTMRFVQLTSVRWYPNFNERSSPMAKLDPAGSSIGTKGELRENGNPTRRHLIIPMRSSLIRTEKEIVCRDRFRLLRCQENAEK